ncbi:T7SS effector LXG polymorphic toxin, partial [Bacillus paralicheniformis]|uniref:T7SS effector LXG polymorphic toxin n=1 Tax=Bacillus paralicheniformis TaxID=1648923 RepID=UPI00227F3EDE
MKTLDVQALHKAIDQTLEQLKQQSEEFAQVKKSVEDIASLDDALKGKGGLFPNGFLPIFMAMLSVNFAFSGT